MAAQLERLQQPAPRSYAAVAGSIHAGRPTPINNATPMIPSQHQRLTTAPPDISECLRILHTGETADATPAMDPHATRIIYVADIPRQRKSLIRAIFSRLGIRSADIANIDWHNGLLELIVRKRASKHITTQLRKNNMTVHDRLSIENPALFSETDWLSLPKDDRVLKSNELFLARLENALGTSPPQYTTFLTNQIAATRRFIATIRARDNTALPHTLLPHRPTLQSFTDPQPPTTPAPHTDGSSAQTQHRNDAGVHLPASAHELSHHGNSTLDPGDGDVEIIHEHTDTPDPAHVTQRSTDEGIYLPPITHDPTHLGDSAFDPDDDNMEITSDHSDTSDPTHAAFTQQL